jgi:hypothetical protein
MSLEYVRQKCIEFKKQTNYKIEILEEVKYI